jgi:hypothetical protein
LETAEATRVGRRGAMRGWRALLIEPAAGEQNRCCFCVGAIVCGGIDDREGDQDQA